MLYLSPETEALARTVAEARHLSVDAAVRGALEAQSVGQETSVSSGRVTAVKDVATRREEAFQRYAAEIAKLPDLDTRSVKEITDDINPL